MYHQSKLVRSDDPKSCQEEEMSLCGQQCRRLTASQTFGPDMFRSERDNAGCRQTRHFSLLSIELCGVALLRLGIQRQLITKLAAFSCCQFLSDHLSN